MSNENSHHQRETALQANPRKKLYSLFRYFRHLLSNYSPSCRSDPLVGHGRHFGRTVHTWCSIRPLLSNGLLRMGELADEPEDSFTLA